MDEPASPPITPLELERLLKEADAGAFLVPPRILRRVIKADRGLGLVGGPATHRESYVLSGASLRAIVTADELGLKPSDPWPETATLLVRPEPEDLAATPRAEVLLRYWRRLFHARVQVALDRGRAEGRLTEGAIRDRIGRIGRVEFAEARSVLQQDNALLPPRDDREVYREFAAVFLEYQHFLPAILPHDFPAIEAPEAVAAVLADDVDAAALQRETRLAGAPLPRPPVALDEADHEGKAEDDEDSAAEPEPPHGYERWLLQRAEAAASRGNLVRAAILQTWSAHRAGPVLGRRARSWARGEMDRLARRLQAALGCDDAELDRWRRALPALLRRAARGFWLPEARLLYDLQKVCKERESDVFTVDLVEWARSLGRRPLKRSLPHLREVMASNHLRRAARRLPSCRLVGHDRERLDALLHAAVARAEEALRARFRPTIDATLAREGFRPRNLPERVAYQKLIEELLDKIVERGYLALGDLRDACSRSNLKVPDLAGPLEFVRGDRLLRTDSALAEELDGVYRRGEVYLRMLQRFSSLAFATPGGRFCTLYFVLPFGGVFVALEGLKHLIELVGRIEVHFATPPALLWDGLVALGLINFPAYRRDFLTAVRGIGRALRALVIDLPAWVLGLPLVRALIESRVFTAVWRFALKPSLVIAPFWALGWLWGLRWSGTLPVSAGGFAAFSLLINSRFGRDAEEIVADGAARVWRRFWIDLVPGLFRWVLQIFQRFLEGVERLIYAVDEWLLFRSGQRRGSIAVKAVLGFVWFFVAYLVRIYVNLLIEPQVNPIKHFPVVTVSHKIILPLSKTLTLLVAAPLMPLGPVAAYTLAGVTVLLFPGVFGFLVWELKENWRLYDANRPEALRPVLVGHHGETLSRLLRPGFHSGTVPKLFAKLRHAERRALEGGVARGIHRRREALHHVEHEVRRFIERDFLALLRGSRALGPLGVEAGTVKLATNRIRVEFQAGPEGTGFAIEFVEESGTLVAGAARPIDLHRVNDLQRPVLATAILGLYAMSDVVRIGAPVVSEGDAEEGFSQSGSSAVFTPLPRSALTWERWVFTWNTEAEEVPSAIEATA